MKKNYQESFNFMKKFLSCDGISGYEWDISKVFIEEVKKAKATITRDRLGSIITKFGTKGPKIMIAAHMDEVGFLVQRIEKEGFLRISNLGRQWTHAILGNKVKVINTKGKEFFGVIGSTSVHVLPEEEAKKVMKMSDLYVDIGFDSRQEVEEAGIDAGDRIVRVSDVSLLEKGDKFMSKAVDDRFGLSIAAKLAQQLKDKKLNSQVYIVATSQEEIGSRGAITSVGLIEPDVAIALDTDVAHDTPNIMPGDTKLGKGVIITMKDEGAISNPFLANQLYDLAKEKNISAYKVVSQGGLNDAEFLQYGKGGVPTVTVSIPQRYLHTSYEVGSLEDFEQATKLLLEFTLWFDKEKYEKIIYKV